MKKKITLLLLVLVSLLVLAGCACEHDWEDADCVTPKTCSECDETEGAPLGHSWMAATCEAPKTCENCGETEGEARPHEFSDATCDTAKTCTVCGLTEGDALGHQWLDATYDTPTTCEVCGITEGEPLFRTDLGMDSDTMAVFMNAISELLGYELEFWGYDEDGWPVYSVNELASGNWTGIDIYFEPTVDGSMVYAIAIYAEDISIVDPYVMGAIAGAALVGLDENFDYTALAEVMSGEPIIMDDGRIIYSMESCGIIAEMQATEESAMFWIYPAA